jgi:D-alanyl-lipoteichoic acid acyltransferase DltB (MBOAT superfamily)
MIFNSITFAVFLPVVFTIYWSLANRKLVYQNILLLVASYVFYGFWDARFLVLIFVSSLSDYLIGLQLAKAEKEEKRKRWLGLSLLINLGVLFSFKYFNFFLDSFSILVETFGFQANKSTLQIILPVGISFYTFQTLSYTIDIYKNKIKPTRNFIDFFTFVSFFPQLVAGPIERASHLLPQFQEKRYFTYENANAGLRLILWGLFKKVVVADRLAYSVSLVYDSPQDFSGFAVILATAFFAIQIYCDFSGYSDIAIGTARLFGFDLMTNFKTPYLSTSIRDFWQRWHISLSTWFRDYVYIPLGGNRVSTGRWWLNVMTTFTVSGLWHGANWTFVIWGGIHGLFYAIEKQFEAIKLPKFLSGILVFTIVCIAWIFFRADTLNDAILLIQNATNFTQVFDFQALFINKNYGIYTIIAIGILIIFDILNQQNEINDWLIQQPKIIRWAIYYFLLFAIVFFGEFTNAPEFIYFRF